MSGLKYSNMRGYIQDMPMQYGTEGSAGSALQGMSGIASLIPFVGPLLGAGMNMIGTAMQNSE